MTTFIQLHLLTAYPAANLNRDDTGAPKTVVLGGATRLRVSSQSLKRAWRTSALFEQALAGHIGIRSGRIAREAATILIEKGIEDKKAIEWSAKIADYLGKAKNDKYSAAIFLIPICISFDTAEKRRYATYLILNRRFSFEF